uniref:Uncharacterized protein n=1 Tax=Ananas comosus var. bracteatus TaxID=296719 RepID=A0A6V7PS84_ANACO|nr:unnamed protein product [Ananas comosus var. bracteatus]
MAGTRAGGRWRPEEVEAANLGQLQQAGPKLKSARPGLAQAGRSLCRQFRRRALTAGTAGDDTEGTLGRGIKLLGTTPGAQWRLLETREATLHHSFSLSLGFFSLYKEVADFARFRRRARSSLVASVTAPLWTCERVFWKTLCCPEPVGSLVGSLRSSIGASLRRFWDLFWTAWSLVIVEFASLPSCSFAHACEGRSLQAGTPELAYAAVARPCEIGCRSGLPWGVFTTTGPLGAAQAGLPW